MTMVSRAVQVLRRRPARRSGNPLDLRRRDRHSQNGEDGIIGTLLEAVGARPGGWVVEFGAWDGKHLSNTFALVERGWRALFIEGDSVKFKDLEATARQHIGIVPVLAFVAETGPESLTNLLATHDVPTEFDVLSIDVDGPDYQLWRSLDGYHPKVVVIEVNSYLAPPVQQVHSPLALGSSLASMAALGTQKGYTVVAHTGNAVFVRSDLLPRVEAVCGPTPRDLSRLFDRRWV